MEGLRRDKITKKKGDKGRCGCGEAYPERAEQRAGGTLTLRAGCRNEREASGR